MKSDEPPRSERPIEKELEKHTYVEIESKYLWAEPALPDWLDLQELGKNYWRGWANNFLEQNALVMAAFGISETAPTKT